MHALVIGGNGFIGSHLVDGLLARGWRATVLDVVERRWDETPRQARFIRGDFAEPYLLREALVGVDTVYHLAWTTIPETANQDPAADVFANLAPSIRLIEASQRAGVRRFVFMSSGGTVYGPGARLPVGESEPCNPVTAYGVSKLAVEKYLQMYHHSGGLDYAILRPSVPYGPRQNPLGKQGAINVFLHRVGHSLPVTIWGDGRISRDFFYVGDLVEALLACASAPLDDERIFNIGGQEEITLQEVLEVVERTVGKAAQLELRPARAFDVPRVVLDTGRARRVLGWQPRVGLEDGVARTWAWIRKTFSQVQEQEQA
jgi:UDP-glucose 4-epimerase